MDKLVHRIQEKLHKNENGVSVDGDNDKGSSSRASQDTMTTSGTTPTASIDQQHPHVFSNSMAFVLREEVLDMTGDMYVVNDIIGVPRYKVCGKNMVGNAGEGGGDKKMMICDMDGSGIYEIKEATLSLHQRLTVDEVKSGKTVLTIKRKSFKKGRKINVVHVWKTEDGHGHGHGPWLSVRGDFKELEFTVAETDSGDKVAVVKQKSLKSAKKKIELKKEEYLAKVVQGNNSPLLLTLVIAIDEFYRADMSAVPYG
eukprot:Plantae.Rhodophyta-Hildenbrandia_rubra.ctg18424.p1 GENE.Plantae.Rhodophyta-Hildenbrandia_rubra.ctg18424~~Plantae.Rhodophyta-Hildenbrandia_rubra.ctg18424.p1  ORF type:complete len:256 (-),score=60.12 Plantae.Rhodophyta-Hildenbrandia_rubra.ctg18424:2243-3010(-)